MAYVCLIIFSSIRKVDFMIDLTWKLFSKTGNIETYLLLKELEEEFILQEGNQEMTSGLDNKE